KEKVYKAYDEYNFSNVIKTINKYVVELSSFYLNITKDILYVHEFNSNERMMTLANFYDITNFLIKAIAPIIPTTSKLSKWMLSSLFILLKCIYASSAVVGIIGAIAL
ncbi:class I tRNA ligase family protein, partial [Mycoplasmopsis bovis]|uniref:class I tRNA ligase family protein n=1 Tax=Mycoplasmopsis bovis TaxID=28903 RepID=UPI003D2AEA68